MKTRVHQILANIGQQSTQNPLHIASGPLFLQNELYVPLQMTTLDHMTTCSQMNVKNQHNTFFLHNMPSLLMLSPCTYGPSSRRH